MRWLLFIAIVFIVIICFLFWQNLHMPSSTGLINGKLHPCPKRPNCVCCCHNEPNYIAPLPFSSENILDQIQAFLESHYIATVVQKTPDYMHVVVTTPLMRFKDDLEFAIDRAKGIVKVRSASRVGYGDGGVNRVRIEALRAFLENNNASLQTSSR